MFKAMDTSNTGVVSVDELRQGLQSRGEMIPEEELKMLLANVDVDGSGMLHGILPAYLYFSFYLGFPPFKPFF